MIKQFNNYTADILRKSKISVGKNPRISDDVVFYNSENIVIGDNVRIDSQCILIAGKDAKIVIGDNVHINSGCVFHGSLGNIIICNNVDIADKVVLYTSSFLYTSIREDKYKDIIKGDIKIDEEVIVGSGVIIMPNVRICTATTIGANSFVKRTTRSYSVYAGNPAKYIKERKIIKV